jgi:hypothetical protein
MAALFTLSVSAATDSYYTYEIENGMATITDVNEAISGDIIIPDAIDGYPVTAIAEKAFYGCGNITGVTVPDTVISIGQYAFYDCPNLKQVYLSDALTSLGANAFSQGIIDLINDQSEYIDGGKYVDGWLVNYVSTDGDIKKIEIADGTIGIADEAFSLAPYVNEIVFADTVKYIGASVSQGILDLRKITLSESLISIADKAFENCTFLGDNVVFPDSLQTIGARAFRNCENLRNVTFGTSLKIIGEYAFEKCSVLTEITLPKNIEYIGDYAFFDCINLQEINWECTDDMGKGVFQNTLLANVVLPSGLEVVSEDTFNNCYELTTIVIPESIKTISKNAFKDSGLTTIFYEGTKAQWNKINIDNTNGGNEVLLNAEMKYSYNADHTHSYSEKRTKKATLKQNGEIVCTCTCGHTYNKPIPKVTLTRLSKTDYVYNNKNKTPSVEVRDNVGNLLVKGTDYELTYESGRKAIGKYSVKITFKGDYKGSKTLEFVIRPAKVSKLTVKKNPTTAVLTWSKVEKATGYAVYKYDGAKQKWVRLKKTTALTYTIKGLNDIDTYNFAVKAYTKTSDGEIYSNEYKKFLLDQHPGIPEIKSIKSTGNGGVTVSWSKAKDADGYRIYLYKNGKAIKLIEVKGTTFSTTISGLQKKQAYRVKVQAYKESFTGVKLYGGFSKTVSFNLK